MRPAVVLLALLLAAPLAAADHAYSHRYLVLAHVAGADGTPVAGAEIGLAPGFTSGACDERPTAWGARLPRLAARTDQDGLAALCLHSHEMTGAEKLDARAAGLNGTVAVDASARVTTVRAVVANASGAAGPLVVHARAWRAGEGQLEGVTVRGAALPNVRIDLTVTTSAGSFERNATTDGYGDVVFRVPVPAGATVTRVTLASAAGSRTLDAPPDRFLSEILSAAAIARSDLRLAPAAAGENPTPAAGLALVAAALLLGGALRRAR